MHWTFYLSNSTFLGLRYKSSKESLKGTITTVNPVHTTIPSNDCTSVYIGERDETWTLGSKKTQWTNPILLNTVYQQNTPFPGVYPPFYYVSLYLYIYHAYDYIMNGRDHLVWFSYKLSCHFSLDQRLYNIICFQLWPTTFYGQFFNVAITLRNWICLLPLMNLIIELSLS